MISNPIIRKEVISSLRTYKATAMQGLFLLALAALVFVRWPPDGLQDLRGSQARQLLSLLAIGELVLVVLFAPAFTAAALTSEREKNTLESLFSTPLRPWEIAVGKMLGSLAFLFLLVLSGAPALAGPFMLGGVRGQEVVAIIGMLLLTAVYLGLIGLLVSSFMHRSYRAIIVAYAILLVICFLAALPAWPISRTLITRLAPPWSDILQVLASFSPLQAMLSLVWPESTYTQNARGMPPFWQIYLVVGASVSVVIATVLLFKLRRPIAPPRPREKLKVVERGKISARTFLFVIDPRKRKKMIRWWQNPVLMKEFRTRPMLQAQWLLRAIGLCLIVSVLLMLLIGLSVTAFVSESASMFQMMTTAVAALMVALIILVGPAMSGGAICSDRESGVWELIRSTRLPSWRIASGKFQAVIIPLLLLVLAMLPALVILLYFETGLWPYIVRILYVVIVNVLFVSTAGMLFSSFFSKTSTATAWTYAIMVALGLLTLLVMLGADLFSQRFITAVLTVNPIAAAMDAAGDQTMARYGLLANHLKIIGAATAVMFLVTIVRVFQLRRPD